LNTRSPEPMEGFAGSVRADDCPGRRHRSVETTSFLMSWRSKTIFWPIEICARPDPGWNRLPVAWSRTISDAHLVSIYIIALPLRAADIKEWPTRLAHQGNDLNMARCNRLAGQTLNDLLLFWEKTLASNRWFSRSWSFAGLNQIVWKIK
jgi:hypothetical protein